MRKGYYLWRWYGINTIIFEPHLTMHCDDYARTQDCFKRFDECKKKAIKDLQTRINELEQELLEIKSLKATDVKRKGIEDWN